MRQRKKLSKDGVQGRSSLSRIPGELWRANDIAEFVPSTLCPGLWAMPGGGAGVQPPRHLWVM